MPIRTILDALPRRWLFVALAAVLGAGLGLVSSLSVPEVYESKASAILSIRGNGSVADLQQGELFIISKARSYSRLANSDLVLQRLEGVNGRVDPSIVGRVTGSSIPETSIMQIAATGPTPESSRQLAMNVVRALERTVRAIDGHQSNDIRLTPMEAQSLTAYKIQPKRWISMGFGLVTGLAVGSLFAELHRRSRRGRSIPGVVQA